MPRAAWIALGVLAAAAAAAWLAPSAAAVPVPMRDISSAGPLDHVYIGADLSCQVGHSADEPRKEFYSPNNAPAACGTYVNVGAIMYTPDPNGHCDIDNGAPCANSDGNAYNAPGEVSQIYSYVSQSPITGSGTNADPFSVTTVVDAGNIRVSQTDTYEVDTEEYHTHIVLQNTDSQSHDYILLRAGDCYLGPPASPPDNGRGWVPGDGVACTVTANNNPPSRFIRMSTTTPGFSYMEGQYNDVWTAVGTHNLPNTCTCNTLNDNGLAISWAGTLLAGASTTIDSTTSFSPGPPANQPPTVSISYDNSHISCSDSAVRFFGIMNDPDGYIKYIDWDFGDTRHSSDPQPSHAYDTGGNKLVTLTIKDNKGAQAVAQAFVPAVADTNCCPILHPINGATITEGEFVRFFAVSEDLEGDPVQYTITPALPPGAVWDADSGYFFWRTEAGSTGDYSFTVTVSDGYPHTPACGTEGSDAGNGRTGPVVQGFQIHVTRGPDRVATQDADHDGFDDYTDNCPGVPNADQADDDSDGIGNACQAPPPVEQGNPDQPRAPGILADRDGDLVLDDMDNCPGIPNSDQKDLDLDRLGDLCDSDIDGDGVAQNVATQTAKPAILDNCPLVPNADQADTGNTGIGDACRPMDLLRPAIQGESTSSAGKAAFGVPDHGWPLTWWLAAFALVAGMVTVGLILAVTRRHE